MVPGLPLAERGNCFQGDTERSASHLLTLGGGCRQSCCVRVLSCPHTEVFLSVGLSLCGLSVQ